MIRVENGSVVFGGRPLFSDLDWQITEESRVGLVGVNGSGKSTLLKVLAGSQELETGSVLRARSFTVGYLPQELQSTSSKTVFEEALAGCGTARELQLQIEDATTAMQTADPKSEEYGELVHEYGRLHRLFESADGFSLETKTSRVLQGLAIPQDWWHNPVNRLSGGWQMRVQLAKLILSAPSLLLLDEPTNHLDLESILWLSSFLRTYEGGLVLISHDRYFLDENIRQIVEIWNGRLHFYQGNYSYYRSEKEKRLELLQSAYKNQQDEIARTTQFIERFRYKATKAKQVQSRLKMLEKMERIELPQATDEIRLRIPPAPRSGKTVIEAEGLGHFYGKNEVFQNLNFRIERGEKIALAGVNGAGKTTLLKILSGVLPPSKGQFKVGHNVEIAYFSQIVTDSLDVQNTVLQEISAAATHQNETELRSILGSFLFTGDDVYKRISVLSGGEKSRVALAKILLKHSNLLLLDEPTNHLDLASKEILLQALQNYEGAILFISHDRYFMDRLAEKIFELRSGILTEFIGNYSEYVRFSESQEADSVAADDSRKDEQPESAYHKSKDQKKLEAEQRKQQAWFRKEVIQPLEKLEKEIALKEARIQELEGILAKDETYADRNQFQRFLQEYQDTKTALENCYKNWELLEKKRSEVEAL